MRALRSIGTGLSRHQLWMRLALSDIQQTYRRSLFGMAWIAFSFAMFIGVKIFIFGSMAMSEPRFFSVWLGVGFWLWLFMTSAIIEGTNVFVQSRAWILGTSIPLTVFVFQSVTRVIIRLLFSFPIVILLLVYHKYSPTMAWLWLVPGFLALILNAIWVQIFFGIICSKLRDLTHLITAIMSVMLFLTPILYTPDMLGDKAYLFDYNPFTHYLSIIREPILSNTFPILAWTVVGTITVIGWILAIAALQVWSRRVPFWV